MNSSFPLAPVPPPNKHIILVGLTHTSNGRTCDEHPDGCGISLVTDRFDNGIGMLLRLRNTAPNELAAYFINEDGTDGCRVGFAKRSFAAGARGPLFDGCIVRLVDVYTIEHENPSARAEAYRNYGYAHGEITDNHSS